MNILPRLQERIHPQELIELRAKIEAKPIPARPASRRENWGRDMIAFLRSQDADDEPRPLPPLTDWSARLDADLKAVGHRLDSLAEALVREVDRTTAVDQYAVHVATAPLLSELTELRAVTLTDWRQALRVHAEDELALIDAEMAVSL